MPPSAAEDERERMMSAAFRLKHDVGKAVRWNAPSRREKDPETLRRRLTADLARTRTVNGRTLSAVEVFDAWRSEDSHAFSDPRWRDRLGRIAAAVDVVRFRLPGLQDLAFDELIRLDEAAREIAEETRGLWKDVMNGAGEGPS